MLFFSKRRPVVVVENPYEEILTLPIIIEDVESDTESDFEDHQQIFIIVPPPIEEWNGIEIEIRIEPVNVEYVEVDRTSDSMMNDDSMTNDLEEMDIDEDDFGELSDSKQSTRILDSIPDNEMDFHITVNTNEAESSNSRYNTAYDHTI